MSVVTSIITDPSGASVAGLSVVARLIASTDDGVDLAGYQVLYHETVLGTASTMTDDDGCWELDLVPNEKITPANTFYRVREQQPGRLEPIESDIRIPDTEDSSWLYDLLIGPPADLPAPVDYATQAEMDAAIAAAIAAHLADAH